MRKLKENEIAALKSPVKIHIGYCIVNMLFQCHLKLSRTHTVTVIVIIPVFVQGDLL